MDCVMTDLLQTQLVVLYKHMSIYTQTYHIPLLQKDVSERPRNVGGAVQMSVLTKLPLQGNSLSYDNILTSLCVYKIHINPYIFLAERL